MVKGSGTIRRLRRNLSLVSSIFIPLKRTIHGKPVVIPSLAKGQPTWPESELWLSPYLKAAMNRRPGTLLDVGANIGQTLLKAKAIDWNAPYVGFEPNIAAAHFVAELIRTNEIPNAQVLAVGLSSKQSVLPLHTSNTYDVSGSLVDGFRNANFYTSSMLVPVMRGDDVVERLALTVGVIKIDVEGGELDVIEGLENTIEKFRPIIFCELLPSIGEDRPSKFRMERKRKLEAVLHRHAYKFSRFSADRSSLSQVDCLPDDDRLDLIDYVFSASEQDDFSRRIL